MPSPGTLALVLLVLAPVAHAGCSQKLDDPVCSADSAALLQSSVRTHSVNQEQAESNGAVQDTQHRQVPLEKRRQQLSPALSHANMQVDAALKKKTAGDGCDDRPTAAFTVSGGGGNWGADAVNGLWFFSGKNNGKPMYANTSVRGEMKWEQDQDWGCQNLGTPGKAKWTIGVLGHHRYWSEEDTFEPPANGWKARHKKAGGTVLVTDEHEAKETCPVYQNEMEKNGFPEFACGMCQHFYSAVSRCVSCALGLRSSGCQVFGPECQSRIVSCVKDAGQVRPSFMCPPHEVQEVRYEVRHAVLRDEVQAVPTYEYIGPQGR